MFTFCDAAASGSTTSTGFFGSQYFSIILLVVLFVAMYFLLIRPQRKKEKKDQEMRNSIEPGDGITTIGGIVARVVSIKDDTILIETSKNNTRLRIKKWAVQDVEKDVVEQPQQ